MNTIENQKEIVQFGVSISQFNIDNLETGLLTMDKFNELEKGQALALAQETESILRQFVSAFEVHSTNKFEGYDAGILFQYVFDKVVEVTYKVIIDVEIDTQFIPSEPFEYHEPDLPEYIQLKLTNAVGKVGHIFCRTIDFIDQKGYRSENLKDWLLPVLIVATYVGMEFAQEIDLDDDSEMEAYLNSQFEDISLYYQIK